MRQKLTFLGLILLLLGGAFSIGKWEPNPRTLGRVPASAPESCFGLIQSFLGPDRPVRGVWKRFTNYVFKGKGPLRIDWFEQLKRKYIREIEEFGHENVEIEKSAEGILAYIEALNSRNQIKGLKKGKGISENLSKLSFFRRRKLQNTIDLLKGDKPPLFQSIDDLLSDIYITTKADGFGLRELLPWQGAHRKALAQIVQEDIARRGLLHVFEKYQLVEDAPSFLRRFIHSKKGTFLATGVFNIPMAFGVPFPLHLPSFKGIRLPDDLARELMMRGLTEEMLIRVDKHITKELYEGLEPNLTKQARYKIIRRYYMLGASAVFTYLMIREYYLLDQATGEELEVVEEISEVLEERASDVNRLKEGHFQIFEDGGDPEEAKINRKCHEIKECLLDFEEEIGSIPAKGTRFFNVCKQTMDPDNLCKKY